MSAAGFYRAFEERFYAPRSVIKGLREQYLPFVTPLAKAYPGAPTFDIGCGRGEWLELMQASGFQPFGVDLDGGMLQACRELGLPAEQGDAIAHLQTLGDSSQAVISAFHVVEHISFEQLETLVVQALRVLKPGGLLIMETPNPENIVVATHHFYLDPTHQRPLPPMLLGFLPEFHGFARVATLRLQESPDIHTRTDIGMTDVLHSVSPDYAVVAQKAADSTLLQSVDDAFAKRQGLDLHALANRFDRRQSEFLTAHHQTRLLLTSQQQQMDAIQAAQHAVDAKLQLIQAERDAAQHAHDAMRDSLSWKITAPLRATASFAASPISFTMGRILQNPRLSGQLNRILMRFPSLHVRLRGTALAQGMMTDPLAAHALLAPTSEADLSPRARQIHTALAQKSQTRGNEHAHPH